MTLPPAGWYPDPQSAQRWRWWNGQTWDSPLGTTTGQQDRFPRALRLPTGLWLLVLGMWAPVLAALHGHHASVGMEVAVGSALGALAAVSSIALGAVFGWRRLWRHLGTAALVGTGALMAWYVVLTLAAPDPTNQNDHAVGAGVVILWIPTLAAVAGVLYFGGAVGFGLSWIRSRRRTSDIV